MTRISQPGGLITRCSTSQKRYYTRGSRKHSGVHALFGSTFAKPGLMDPKFHRWLLDAFDKRLLADYGIEAALTHDDAEWMIAQAREFLEAARQFVARGS